MTRLTRLTMLSALVAGLVACGGGAKLGGGREGAAQAAFQASKPAGRGGKTTQRLLDRALSSSAIGITLSADCDWSGKVSMVLNANVIGPDGSLNYTVKYDKCNEDGLNTYNGTMTTSIRYVFDDPAFDPYYTNGAFLIGMKGKLLIEGVVADFIDVDVRLTMDISSISADSGTVRIVADGYIKTSEDHFTYDASQPLVIVAGELPEA